MQKIVLGLAILAAGYTGYSHLFTGPAYLRDIHDGTTLYFKQGSDILVEQHYNGTMARLPLMGVDAATFKPIAATVGEDKSGFWYFDSKLPYDIDPETFTFLGDYYAKDKNYVYERATTIFGMNILADADSASFVLVSGNPGYDAQDKNHRYSGAQIVQADLKSKNKYSFASEGLISEDENYALYLLYTLGEKNTDQYVLLDKKTNAELLLGGVLHDDADVIHTTLAIPIIPTYDSDRTYIALSAGTSFARGITIYSFSTGEQVSGDFCALNSVTFWRDVALYRDCNNNPLVSVPWEAGLPSIMALNLKTGESRTLVPTDASHYSESFKVEGDRLTYTRANLVFVPSTLYENQSGYWDEDKSSTTQNSISLQAVLADWLK